MFVSVRRAVALLAAVGLVVSACGGESLEEVAEVNGVAISLDDVIAMRSTYGPVAELDVGSASFLQDVRALILLEVISQAATIDYGIEVTDADVVTRANDPPDRYVAAFQATTDNPEFTEATLRFQAATSIIFDSVASQRMRDQSGFIEGFVNDSPEQLAAACTRHILVGTEPEAHDVLARLDAGEEFAVIAAEVSLDGSGSQGGLLSGPGGCMVPLGAFVPEFGRAAATAPIGRPTGPVPTEFGFHVILVEERVDAPDAATVKADPLAYVSSQVAGEFWQSWFETVMRESDVTINSLVGRWSPQSATIEPADG